MNDQYLRVCKLVVGKASGEAIDISDLHIKFRVWQATTQTPHHATIRIYNLSNETAYRVQNEFQQAQLQTGYQNGALTGLISGTLVQKRMGRENGTDTFLDLLLQDGDEAYNWCVVNTTLRAGYTLADVHTSILKALQEYGITKGYTPEFPPTAFPAGRPMFGLARDYLRELAKATKCDWHFSAGKLNMVPIDGYMGDPTRALVLNQETGLIGMPTQTLDGIVVRCLHNANIKVGTLLKIDNLSIQRAAYSADYQAINEAIPSLSNEGVYKVLCVDHEGDTRGNDWYTNIICAARDGTQPITQRTIAAVP